MFRVPAFALVSATFFLVSYSMAEDWPQWRGQNRDGISSEKGLLQSWPTSGPNLLWTFKDAGIGYSGPAVVGNNLFMMGVQNDSESIFALDTNTGKQL